MFKIFSSDTNMRSFLPVLILHPKKVLLNVLTILFLMVSKVVWLVLSFPLPTGPLLFFMSCVSAMLFLVINKGLLLFVCWQGKRTTSRIFTLLTVEFWPHPGHLSKEVQGQSLERYFFWICSIYHISHITYHIPHTTYHKKYHLARHWVSTM